MVRCAACGRETDERADACASCEAELASTLAERLLAGLPGDAAPVARERPAPAPVPLVEALATEVSCPSCRTAVPPASRFCGVCGLPLEGLQPPAGP